MGEEYCDILQVYKGQGGGPVPVQLRHRIALFCMRVIVPYFLQRLAMKPDRSFAPRRRTRPGTINSVHPSYLQAAIDHVQESVKAAQQLVGVYIQKLTEKLLAITPNWASNMFSQEFVSWDDVIQVRKGLLWQMFLFESGSKDQLEFIERAVHCITNDMRSQGMPTVELGAVLLLRKFLRTGSHMNRALLCHTMLIMHVCSTHTHTRARIYTSTYMHYV